MKYPLGICSRIDFWIDDHTLKYQVHTQRNGFLVPLSTGSWASVDWYTVKTEHSPIPRRLVLTMGNNNGSLMTALGEFVCEGMVWTEPIYETMCVGARRN